MRLALIFDLLDHPANLVVGIGRVGSGGGGSGFPSIVVVAFPVSDVIMERDPEALTGNDARGRRSL